MSHPMFELSEEQRLLRTTIRELSEARIAPFAAIVDEDARFPKEAYDSLCASDFAAPHIPEEYGGVGADALSTCIIIEEVARVCASSSLIPAVNKLSTVPLLLNGSEEIKTKYLPLMAQEGALFS